MKLTKKQEINLYAWCLHEGLSLEYGKLSLCDLRNFNYSQVKNNRKYQVHCEEHNNIFSLIYDELEPAIEKFIELKKRTKRIK